MRTFLLCTLLISLAGCMCTKENMETAQTTPPLAPLPLERGTVEVTADVISCQEEDTRYICQLQVAQIHQYGAATPVLSKGRHLQVIVAKTLKTETPLADLLQAKQSISTQLRRPAPTPVQSETSAAWQVVRINLQ